MADYTNTYPDLVNVEDWLNAKGYTGEAGACHAAMSLIRKQEARIEELRKEADMMHSEYKTARASINDLKAALEAKDRRIADLEKMLAVHRLAVDVDALKARIAELKAAMLRIGQPGKQIVYCRDGHEETVLLARAAYLGEKE